LVFRLFLCQWQANLHHGLHIAIMLHDHFEQPVRWPNSLNLSLTGHDCQASFSFHTVSRKTIAELFKHHPTHCFLADDGSEVLSIGSFKAWTEMSLILFWFCCSVRTDVNWPCHNPHLHLHTISLVLPIADSLLEYPINHFSDSTMDYWKYDSIEDLMWKSNLFVQYQNKWYTLCNRFDLNPGNLECRRIRITRMWNVDAKPFPNHSKNIHS
jgi:hypothetical protein